MQMNTFSKKELTTTRIEVNQNCEKWIRTNGFERQRNGEHVSEYKLEKDLQE